MHGVGSVGPSLSRPHAFLIFRSAPFAVPNSTSRSKRTDIRVDCAQALTRVDEFVDGELHDGEPHDRCEIEAHLRHCPACARIARQLAAQRARLHAVASHDAIAPTRAPSRLVERVRASLSRRSA
jgi:anti-sigma factor RsiW